jgi:hypothetical protein
MNKSKTGGRLSSSTPGESGKRPLSTMQSSGKTKFSRMTTATKVSGEGGGQSLKNPPKTHC